MSSIIRVSKKPENMDDITFLKLAIKEMQTKMKNKGETFEFDIDKRNQNKIAKRNR